MKKGWKIAIKVIEALVWLWGKIKPGIPDSNNDNNVSKKK